jgi:hypothetical protein
MIPFKAADLSQGGTEVMDRGCAACGLPRTPRLGNSVNRRFPRLVLSFTEWQCRGNEGERSRLRLTVEVRTYRHGLPRTHTY